MTYETADIESTALHLYERASRDPAREVSAIGVARGLGLDVRFTPRLETRARLVVVPVPRIELRAGLSRAGAEYDAGHETPHWHFDRYACGDPQLERLCDRVAVALVAPRPAMYLLRAVFGHDVVRIARTLGTSELIVALRWAEVFDETIAVDVGRGVKRAGPGVLPADRDLRAIVRAGRGDGVRVVSLSRGWMVIGEW